MGDVNSPRRPVGRRVLTTTEVATLKRTELQAATVQRFGKTAASWTGRATNEELREALRSGGGIFDRLHREMEENNLDIYKPGPWNAGLEPFPPKIGS